MSRFVYVNGRYAPYADAAIHVEDRGFQFGDAVYEVCEVVGGRLVDEVRHLDRLERSLAAIRMEMPMSRRALRHVLYETLRRNRVRHGTLYLQVSRGAGPRDFLFPDPPSMPTVVVIARAGNPARTAARLGRGIAVVTTPDQRWARCDIKTVMLLPACLAKSAARDKGAQEAWLVDKEGLVTEGASSNAWIVLADGSVVTRFADNGILAGVTRRTLIDAIGSLGLTLVERRFSVDEAKAAREAFITSASNTVMPVTSIDGQPVGDGRPGTLTLAMQARFREHAAVGEAPLAQ
jgi:D-alanine transaminase